MFVVFVCCSNRSLSKDTVNNRSSLSKGRLSTRSSLSARTRSNSPRPPIKTIASRHSLTSTSSQEDELSSEINTWLQQMKLSKVVRNPKQDFSNGYLVAEIFHNYFGPGGAGEVSGVKYRKHLPPLTRFFKTSNKQAKVDNWILLQKAAKKLALAEFPS